VRKQRGFSLIELLIVVAIILIIAAIAIPNLMRSKIAANEASAVASVRTIITAEATYVSTYPETGYATTIGQLGPKADNSTPDSSNADLIDRVLAAAVDDTHLKSGFYFTLAPNGESAVPYSRFKLNAQPKSISMGLRNFYSDETGVIRAAQGISGATSTSTALNQQ